MGVKIFAVLFFGSWALLLLNAILFWAFTHFDYYKINGGKLWIKAEIVDMSHKVRFRKYRTIVEFADGFKFKSYKCNEEKYQTGWNSYRLEISMNEARRVQILTLAIKKHDEIVLRERRKSGTTDVLVKKQRVWRIVVDRSKKKTEASSDKKESKEIPRITKDWVCGCGRVNKSYVGTCACGKSKYEVQNGMSGGVSDENPEQANDSGNKNYADVGYSKAGNDENEDVSYYANVSRSRNDDYLKKTRHEIRYQLEHVLLPKKFYYDKIDFVCSLLNDRAYLFNMIDEMFKVLNLTNPYQISDFNVQELKLGEEVMVIKLTFPEPEEEPLCYCCYLFFDTGFKNSEYYLVEMGKIFDNTEPFICSWKPDGTYNKYGTCSLENGEDYAKCKEYYLAQYGA